jgi:hypothetical protein
MHDTGRAAQFFPSDETVFFRFLNITQLPVGFLPEEGGKSTVS